MSVLEGEGTTLILYGSIDIPLGARSRTGYLARPDGVGEWPTVVVVPGARGLSSSVKDQCRRMARHGIAAIAADPVGGRRVGPSASPEDAREAFASVDPRTAAADVGAFGRFITNPAAEWSNAERGYGVLGIDGGAVWAAAHASTEPRVVSLALVDPPLQMLADPLRAIDVPILGTAVRSDAEGWDDDFGAVRDAAAQAEWALYATADHGFWDIARQGYDHGAATDSFDRVVGFFGRTLPPRD